MTSSMIFYLNSSCDQTNPHELFFVKVHGHSGDPLHEEADRLAVEEADKESDNENILYPGGRGQEMVKKCIKAHEEKMSWQTRSQKTHAEEFLAKPNAARPQLGVALRSI